jgi:hypothetical protein
MQLFKNINSNKKTELIDPLNYSTFRIPIAYLKDKINIKKEFADDLELLEGKNPLYQKFLNTNDEFSKLLLKQHAKWFTNNKQYILDTQKILSNEIPEIVSHNDIMTVKNNFKNEEDLTDKYNYFEWDKIKFLNKNSQIMQAYSLYNISSPVFSLCLPIFLLILPFFLIKLQGYPLTWSQYSTYLQIVLRNHSLGQIFNIKSASWDKRVMIMISFIFYLLQVYFNFMSCIKFIKNMTNIHYTIFTVKDFLYNSIQSMNKLSNNWNKYSTYQPFINKNNLICQKAQSIYLQLNKISILKLSFNKVVDIGQAMRAFYMINIDEEWKTVIDYCIYYNVYIKNLTSIKSEIKKNIYFCKFSKTTRFKDIYYPHINNKNAIKNSVKLNKNIIITGPNAAGKTTMLKSIIINVLLSQQFGCGYYKTAYINLYDVLSSYINIPDTSARDSLFQAEARRCKEILDEIQKNKSKKHLCIFDELYSGTNPYEAISAATGYLKYLDKNKNVTFILTTHYLDLCKILEDESNVKNLQMQVDVNDKDFIYTYKIIDGISKIKGGIKVLNDLKYPDEILDECNKLLKDSINTFI